MNILPRVVEHTPQGNVGFTRNKKSIVHVVGSQSINWASSQGLRQYFQYFECLFYEPGLKSNTFYIVGRCASVWRGPGFFWSCICGKGGHLKLGFCRSVFIK